MNDHQDFEQLAVGYAMHALEPADEQLLTTHLVSCAHCQSVVIDAGAVTTALAQIVAAAVPPADLRERILWTASREPRALPLSPPRNPRPASTSSRDPQARVMKRLASLPASERRGTRPARVRGRLLTGALAAVVAIAVAIPTTLALSRPADGRAGDAVLAQKMLESGSREVSLTSTRNSFSAKAVFSNTGALMIADDLPANAGRGTTYVLWAANRSGIRTAIATFDVTGGKVTEVATPALPFNIDQITQIAVSFEPGRHAPSAPSDIVLSGSSA